MGYISTEAYNASVIYSFSELSPNDKFMLDKNGETQTCTLKEIKAVSGGITLRVVAPEGYVLSVSDGTTTFSKDSEVATFNIPSYGTWTVTGVKNGITKTKNVVVDHPDGYNVSFLPTYGIQRDIASSSPEWTRTDDSANFTATASVGSVAGHSDFDDVYPWSEMKRYKMNVPNNNNTPVSMVRIPKFWYKREVVNNIETIKIASGPVYGFDVHPGSDCYVGSYNVGSYYLSYPSTYNPRITLTTLSDGRNSISSKGGTGWSSLNLAAWSAIQMLYLVEFANNDCQAAFGVIGCASKYSTGASRRYSNIRDYAYYTNIDNVPNLTGGTMADYSSGSNQYGSYSTPGYVIYRGFANIWGLESIITDGVLLDSNNHYWICNDVSNYSDTVTSNYKKLSYNSISNTSVSYITQIGYDPNYPWVMLPTEASGGSATTYYCDGGMRADGDNMVIGFGTGFYADTGNVNKFLCGIFTFRADHIATNSTSDGNYVYYPMYKPELDTNNTTTIVGLWDQ